MARNRKIPFVGRRRRPEWTGCCLRKNNEYLCNGGGKAGKDRAGAKGQVNPPLCARAEGPTLDDEHSSRINKTEVCMWEMICALPTGE